MFAVYSIQSLLPALSDASVISAVTYLWLSGDALRKHHFKSPLASCACVLLTFMAAQSSDSWPSILHQLSVAMLPLLAQFSSGQLLFKVANFVWVQALAQVANDVEISARAIGVLLHACILLESLDASEWWGLRRFLTSALYLKEIALIQTLRARELTFNDFGQLPERLRIRVACQEFAVNPQERFFAARALIRMAWRPLLPLMVVQSLLRAVPVYHTVVLGYALECVDNPSKHPWYEVYLHLGSSLVLLLVMRMVDRVNNSITAERQRITRAISLRQLQHHAKTPGSEHMHVETGYSDADGLLESMLSAWASVSWLISALASLYTAYQRVGRAAAFPVVLMVAMAMAERMLIMFHSYDSIYYLREFAKDNMVDDIYSNIKTIKFNCWEEKYLNKPSNRPRTTSAANSGWKAYILSQAFAGARFAYRLATQLSAQISSFITVRWRFQSGQKISGVEMLQLIDQFSNLERSLQSSICAFRQVRNIAAQNKRAEEYLCPKPIPTIKVIKDTTGSSPAIELNQCSFAANKLVEMGSLSDVSLHAKDGELISVMGSVGSGKSLLLLAMCGEARLAAGTGSVVGKLAYVDKNPFFLDDTVRANILFGNDYNDELYWRVIKVCALAEDIGQWRDHDLTAISDGGSNISGGQKARLALARAVYTQADIYILDDPLSAVDPKVRRHLLDHVLLNTGILGDKLRVVSMNSDHLKPFANKNIFLENRKATVEVQAQPRLHSIATNRVSNDPGSDSDNSLDTKTGAPATTTKEALVDSAEQKESVDKSGIKWANILYLVQLFGIPVLSYCVVSALFDPIVGYIFDGLAIDALNGNRGAIDGRSLLKYAGARALTNITNQVIHRAKQYIRKNITEKHVGDRVHQMLISGLVLSPISLFEGTNHYETKHKLRECESTIANELPAIIQSYISAVIAGVLCVYRVGSNAPLLLLLAPLLLYVSRKPSSLVYMVQERPRAIELKYSSRMDNARRPLASGQRTIRLHDVGEHFISRFAEASDDQLCVKSMKMSTEVLARGTDVVIGGCLNILTMSAIIMQSQISGSAITAIEFQVFQSLVRNLIWDISCLVAIKSSLRTISNAVDIFREFSDRPREKAWTGGRQTLPPDWPSKGDIEIRNYSMRYKPENELVLRNVSLRIKGGEHIGIVGRTGAGKSSLARALFRLVEGESGSVLIDGVDISTLRADFLRPNLAIMPQDSTLFTDTVKANLDPLNQFTIEDMWAALQTANAVEMVNSAAGHRKQSESDDETKGALDGDAPVSMIWRLIDFVLGKHRYRRYIHRSSRNWGLKQHISPQYMMMSAGQRQKFSLSRTLMRKRKILVLDEATADVDMATDKDIHDVIHKEFAGCTILTIAHRLDTVMNSDRIVVMDNGCVAEFDTPANLLAKGGLFADLVASNNL